MNPSAHAACSTSLNLAQWQQLSQYHYQQVIAYTQGYRDRRARRQSHPVYDFLFTYYNFSTTKLESWRPALNQKLDPNIPLASELAQDPRYHQSEEGIALNPQALSDKEKRLINNILPILQASQNNPAQFGCFGLHEWAMVYRQDQVRHRQTPLRMSPEQLQHFLEQQKIACSHFDAFRFFTPAARPLNQLQPRDDNRPQWEQAGCVHTNMDLYKWCYKLYPWCGSELLRHTFSLALDCRTLDMQASPYDLTAIGFPPVLIETEAGRQEYAQRQKALSQQAAPLRQQLIDLCLALYQVANSK